MTSRGEFFADKLMDLANLAATVLVFGQWVAPDIHLDAFLIGAAFYGFCGVISYLCWREKK